MRIVIVSPNSLLTLRGSEHYVLETAKQFSKYPGVGVSIVTFRRKYGIEDLSRLSEDEVRSRVRTIQSALGTVSWNEFRWLSQKVFRRGRAFDQLNRLMEFVPPERKLMGLLRNADRIYFVTWRPEDLLAFLPAALLAGRKRVVAGVHSRMLLRRPEIAMLTLWARLGVLRAVHTIDPQSTRIFETVRTKVVQIPNDVDCDVFKPGEKAKGEFVVLFVGSAHTAKGADLLPAIHAGIRSTNISGIKIWVCTSQTGQLGREIVAWSRGEPDVVYKGWLTRSELAVAYRQASVLLMPSRREVQGLSNLEAQASGTPVVVSDLPSFRATVKDGETGFIVRKFQASAFAEKVMQLHSIWLQGEPYAQMCREARKNIVENYASPAGSRKLLSLLSAA
jgi:glycosyltransferase involved in cell wall biosynthesis